MLERKFNVDKSAAKKFKKFLKKVFTNLKKCVTMSTNKKGVYMARREQTSLEIKEELSSLTNEQLRARYLLPANNYNPNDLKFMEEVIEVLRKKDKNGMFIYRNIVSLMDTKCYNDLATILFAKVLTNTLRLGYRINLDNYLFDLERMLKAPDSANWLLDFMASGEKETSSPEFSEFCEFIGSKLILKHAVRARNITTGIN